MAAYHREVDIVAGHFKGYQVDHVDRRKNEAAEIFTPSSCSGPGIEDDSNHLAICNLGAGYGWAL